jgi:transcription termination/antitermination protein NusG
VIGEQQIWRTSVEHPAVIAAPRPTCWYAVHTRSRHEKRAAFELRDKGMAAFLPTFRVTRRWSDRNRLLEVPLFSGYLFVQTVLSAETRLAVLQAAGVVGLVGTRPWATPIPDKQIEDLQTLLSQETPVAFHPFLREGQRVRVRGGCLDGIEGVLIERLSERDLVISVEPICRSVTVRITDYDVEPV